MSRPQISVIVPVFNVQPYLSDCLESIRQQSYRHFEVVIIDDGSNDGSDLICDDYAQLDSRFKSVHTENRGVSLARNTGIGLANGAYLTFVDSDDILHPDFLKYLFGLTSKAFGSVVSCSSRNFSQTPPDCPSATSSTAHVLPSSEAIAETLYQRLENAIWGKLIPATLLSHNQFPQGVKIGEDFIALLEILSRTDYLVCGDAPLYFYRQRDLSAIKSGTTALHLPLIHWLSEKLLHTNTLKSPLINRLFMEAVFASLEPEFAQRRSSNSNVEAISGILRRYRLDVLRDKSSRKSYRVLAFLSFFSPKAPALAINIRSFIYQRFRFKKL